MSSTPEPRQPVRLLHTSDVHLADRGGWREGEHLDRCLCSLDGIERLVAEHETDVVLIAGDLFDHARLAEDFVARVFARLDELGPEVVLLVGNHDVHDHTSLYDRYGHVAEASSVHLLLDHAGSTVDLLDGRLRVWGKAMNEHSPEYQPLTGVAPRPHDRWFVVMGHGLHAPDPASGTGRSSLIRPDAISATGADYVALGHHHHQLDVSTESTTAWYSARRAGSAAAAPWLSTCIPTPAPAPPPSRSHPIRRAARPPWRRRLNLRFGSASPAQPTRSAIVSPMPVTTAAPLDPLLSADSATQRLAVAGLPIAEAVPEYVRHKPGDTTIVSYRFRTTAGEETRGYAHWCADAGRADEIHAKALTLAPRPTPLGDGVHRVDAHTVLYAFPTDARLRRLRWYTTPRKLKRSLSMVAVGATPISEARRRVEILRYKPERRVVVRVDLTADTTRQLLVRYTTGGGAAALAGTARRLRAAGLLVPAPVAQTESDRVGVDEFIDATELRTRVQAAPGTDRDLADGVADALARLHAVVPSGRRRGPQCRRRPDRGRIRAHPARPPLTTPPAGGRPAGRRAGDPGPERRAPCDDPRRSARQEPPRRRGGGVADRSRTGGGRAGGDRPRVSTGPRPVARHPPTGLVTRGRSPSSTRSSRGTAAADASTAQRSPGTPRSPSPSRPCSSAASSTRAGRRRAPPCSSWPSPKPAAPVRRSPGRETGIMGELHRIDRRLFLADLGKGTLGVALLGTGIVACSSSSDGESVTTTTVRTTTTRAGGTGTTVTTTVVDDGDAPDTTTGPGEALRWERVRFGFVSAYVLARDRELAIVDTGVSGGADRFDAAFGALGAGWDDVDHVVLTHLHGDHVGGLGAVLEAAPDAAAYAGSADVAGIDSPRPLRPVDDGDEVFGLRIIATPGHTPGHISVLDADSGLLIAGDALNEEAGDILGPNPSFSSDLDLALASVDTLATYDIDTAVFGHGEPVIGGAGDQITRLAAST